MTERADTNDPSFHTELARHEASGCHCARFARRAIAKGEAATVERIAIWLETNSRLCYTPREFADAIRRSDWRGEA